jgi:hypothetical protein
LVLYSPNLKCPANFSLSITVVDAFRNDNDKLKFVGHVL